MTDLEYLPSVRHVELPLSYDSFAADHHASEPADSCETGSDTSCGMTKSDPISFVSVDFYYEFSRQRADLLMYFIPSEITNAEHLPSGHLIEPMAA